MGQKEMSQYQRPFPNSWWLKKKSYFLFIIRELTSVFVAGYCIFLLVLVYNLAQSPDSYALLINSLRSPISVGFHVITLIFVIYHTITWFNLTPKIMVLYKGQERIPEGLIAGLVYVGWIVVSLLIAWIVLGI